jgi:AraC-like DNA-binding protein
LHPDELVLAPAEEWAPNLNGWHFMRPSQGQAYWRGEAAVVDMNPGELLILSPSRQGLLRASQLGTLYLHSFRFCPDQLISLMTLSERRYLEQFALKPRLIPTKLSADHPAALLLGDICGRTSLAEGLELRAMLLRVVSLSFEWQPLAERPADGAYLPSSKRIRLLMSQLTETELSEIMVEDMADRCGCSVPHFQRLFLNHFGMPFQTRQTELRLIKARQLLAESSLPIKEVAAQVGFRRLSHFYRLFKKEFGLTPADYRRTQTPAGPLERLHA